MIDDKIHAVKEVLKERKKISIVCHRNPDGDAYGSSLAIYHYLKDKHDVTVISPNDCPEFLKWLPAEKDIVVFEKNENQATKILAASDVVFTLDFNALHRTGNATQKVLEKIKPVYIMIDHHQQPDDYATIKFSDTTKSSTCEMVYDFISDLGDSDKVNKEIATCIYTGIMTDTGSFRFPSTTPKTHRIVANLLEKGADNAKIYNNVMDNNSLDRMKLLSKALDNLVLLKEYKTAYITLSQKELNRFNFEKGDTEGFVNYALSIKDVVFAVIFIEDKQQGIIKMSFRSKGSFSVNEFARAHFNGGGHTNAAGGRSEISLKETVNKFLEILPSYKNNLLHSYESDF
ncbi:MAG TPA: bifunctional oligoribonuclease/PAP phosphatase NrnA [Flavobacteriia bacterium]|nr:bifunctional oligoribonuclease/PAP phosphatase NrnA [Flavobacteriia bacterium]